MSVDNFVSGDPSVDFFSQNPELRYAEPFAKLINEHGEERASKLAWAVYMMEDPNSVFYRYERSDRKKEIEDGYLKEKDFDWDAVSELCKVYPSIAMTTEAKLYKFWAEMLDNIRLDINEVADVKERVDIAAKFHTATENFNKSRKAWLEEKDKAKIMGGKQESLLEESFG